MINKKDLRIGNIVLDENNELIEVETIHYDGINYMDGHIYGIEFMDLKPIKLTPEILEQIATKFNNGDTVHFNDKFTVRYIGSLGWHTIDTHGCIDKRIEYLHDLQNIYYYENDKQELPININTLKL
jgi:hypothetical protein